MKNKMSYIIVLLLGVIAVTFYSCEEKDDYDYNSIEPAIFEITGPSPVPAHGLTEFPTRYTVPHRGGSTYTWSVGGHGGSVVQDETFPSIAYITFNQADAQTTASVTVTETTMGGKSASFTRNISLNRFCLIPDAIQGNYEEYEDGYTYSPVVFTKDPTDAAGILIDGISGSWIAPGKMKITLDYCTGDITFMAQPIGVSHPTHGAIRFVPSPDKQSYYDFDTGQFFLFVRPTVAAGHFGDWTYIFTKM